jgi:YHS domain-containing protein
MDNTETAYDGHCAFAVSTGKTDVKGGKSTLTVEGKTYSFSNPIAKLLFRLLPNRIAKADTNWESK